MHLFKALLSSGIAALLATACGGATPQPRLGATSGEAQGSPLGPSYVLVPLPSEDESLLGRILHVTPEPGQSIEEISRPNPCAEFLGEAKTSPLANQYEDAQELAYGATAKATLGTFGFGADVKRASYFVYKLSTDRRIAQTDTTQYVACCKENDCGYGYVSALIHGEGQYSTATESAAEGGGNIGVASAEGYLNLKVINKRKVTGWLAALVTITDKSKTERLGALGIAKQAGIDEDTVPEQVKSIYDNNKVTVTGSGSYYVFSAGVAGEELTENEFIRRYRDVTGSTELDDIEKRRNGTALLLLGAGALAGVGVVAYGNSIKPSESEDFDFDSDQRNFLSNVVMGGGVLMTIGFAIPFTVALFRPDGSTTSHYLTDADARVYAHRYNRALLRKSVRDVKDVSYGPTLNLRPLVGLTPSSPSGFGLYGAF